MPRLNTPTSLSYGEIVALSGDFYGSATELYEETAAALPWLPFSNDTERLKTLFEEELKWIASLQTRSDPGYPDQNIRYWWTAKSYRELAQKNSSHFGWNAIKTYVNTTRKP